MPDREVEQSEFIRHTGPAVPEELRAIRERMRRWLGPLSLDPEQKSDLVLAVSEAAANSVDHAYDSAAPGIIDVAAWTESDSIWIEIADHGHWRTPGAPALGRGLGIRLMQQLVETVLIRHDRRGTQVLFRQSLQDAREPPRHPLQPVRVLE